MFINKRVRIPLFGIIRSYIQRLQKQGQNPSVLKDEIKKPVCINNGEKFIVWKGKARISIFAMEG